MKWKVFFASATGKYHLDRNAPCQDSGHYDVVNDCFVGVVCDGAGSAREGQAGAEFISKKVTGLIADAIRSGGFPTSSSPDYLAFIAPLLASARTELEAMAHEQDLEPRDYACTLVGCIASRDGGFFFHIGDGVAVHQRGDGESVLSQPENGEFADQTYFITDDYWEAHLRLTPLSEVNRGCLIGLMSDGSSPFVINRLRTGFYRPFIDPVMKFLSDASESAGSQALKNLLESEKTFEITPDDKTLLLALAH
jgi:hypothetical protein